MDNKIKKKDQIKNRNLKLLKSIKKNTKKFH